MPTALAVAQATVAKSPVNYVRNGKSYCQTFAGNFWETHFGKPTPNSYASATAAYRASKIASMDPMAAPPGAYHYFEYGGQGGAGHVGVALGSGLMASGTGWGSYALMNLGKNVLVHRVSDYARHLKYLGWSYTNGARAQITGLTDHNAPVIPPNQRVVNSGKDARRRQGVPSTLSPYNPALNLKAGLAYVIDGFVRSEHPGGVANGSNIWLVIGDLYTHISGFTNQTVTGLKDLGTLAPPKPVVRHKVEVHYRNFTDDVRVVEVEHGKLLAPPTPPADDLHDFVGWVDAGGKAFMFDTPITAPLSIFAEWVAKPVQPEEPIVEEPEPADPAPVDPDVPVAPEPPVDEPEPKPAPSWGGLIGGIVAIVLAALGAVFGLGR